MKASSDMESTNSTTSGFWATRIAEQNKEQAAVEAATDAAWSEMVPQVGVHAMKRLRATQEAQEAREAQRVEAARLGHPLPVETEPEVERCPECGSEVHTYGQESQGIAEPSLTGSVQWAGRDPRGSQRVYKRCSSFTCSWPSPRQSGDGPYSAGVRNFLR